MRTTLMNKRAALTALALLALAPASFAQPGGEGATLGADSIVKSLSKDIVLDRPGSASRLQAAQPAVDLNVQFAYNSAELLPQGQRQLDELGIALNNKALSQWGFELGGHTDASGSAEYNLRLSLERANAVKNYLVVRHGLSPQRLQPVGFGFTRLANPANPTAAVNRRVEVRRVILGAGTATPPVAMPAQPIAAPIAPPPQAPMGGRLVTTP